WLAQAPMEALANSSLKRTAAPPLSSCYVGQTNAMLRERPPESAPGAFYVEAGCCLACGIPEETAPDLFDVDAESHCFVKRQPRSDDEVDRMLLTMIRSEVGCIRYGGTDERISRRLAENGEGLLCDVQPSADVRRIHRDHVGLRTSRQFVGADVLLDGFLDY